MNSNEFKKELLKQKRRKFAEVVYNACKVRKLPIPTINFDSCPGEKQNQLAHIHTDINKICVSKMQLTKMTFEDIEETATHEVAHIVEQSHDARFQSEHQNIKQAVWRPPGGIVVIDGGKKIKYKINPRKARKSRTDKVRCNYHLCRMKTELKMCPHCKGYFCSEHSNPKDPGIINYNNPKTKDFILMSEKGHPCPDFVSFKETEKRKQDEKYEKALKDMLSSDAPKLERTPDIEMSGDSHKFIPINPLKKKPHKNVDEIYKEATGRTPFWNKDSEKNKRQGGFNKFIAIGIILLIGVIAYELLQSSFAFNQNIGTPITTTSLTQNSSSNTPETITKLSDIISDMDYYGGKNVTIEGMFEQADKSYYVKDSSGAMKIGYTNIINLNRDNVFDNNKTYKIKISIMPASAENLVSIISYEDVEDGKTVSDVFTTTYPDEQITANSQPMQQASSTTIAELSLNITTPMLSDNPRWRTLPIDIYMDYISCKPYADNIRWAAQTYESETVMKFRFIENSSCTGCIKINCFTEDKANVTESGNFIYTTLGEARITGYYYIGSMTIISGAEFDVYSTSRGCIRPIRYIHELGHALGFDHTNDTQSVMYQYEDCNEIITEEMKNSLSELYSEKADKYLEALLSNRQE